MHAAAFERRTDAFTWIEPQAKRHIQIFCRWRLREWRREVVDAVADGKRAALTVANLLENKHA